MKKLKKKAILFRSTALLLAFLMIAPMFSEKKRTNGSKKLYIDDEVLMLTYNIGDCTFGEDFFSTPRCEVKNNLNGIIELLEERDYDVCFLQESDWLNITNYFINPSKKIADHFSDCSFIYGSNANVLNYYDNGNMTITKYDSTSRNLRVPIQGKGLYNNQFIVHKLLIETRIKIQNSQNELVLFNLHNAPYPKNKELRRKQIKHILRLAKDEYDKGNYVVIAGDWNIDLMWTENKKTPLKPEFSEVFGDNLWTFEMLDGCTYQTIDKEGKTTYKAIDGFLISPNLNGSMKTLGDVKYSDHFPVELRLRLIK